MGKLEKLQFIYKEASENRRLQQGAIEHINTKINWFIVLDGVLIGFLFKDLKNFFDLLTFSLFVISLMLLLSTLLVRDYKTGPKIRDMLDKLDFSEEKIFTKTNEKLVDHKEYNEKIISDLIDRIKLATFFLFLGLLCLLIKAIICIA